MLTGVLSFGEEFSCYMQHIAADEDSVQKTAGDTSGCLNSKKA